MQPADQLAEALVVALARRLLALAPVVQAQAGDLLHLTHHRDVEGRLVRLDQPIALYRVSSVSWAPKTAAAF
jgi:hypothetical protein